MQSLVIAETPTCLWLNKPAGIPVFKPHQDPGGDCVLARLLAERPDQNADFPDGFEAGILHRLDVSTSGVVLAARRPQDFATLRSLFTDKRLSKTYRFLSNAEASWTENTVDAAIAHDKRRKKRMVVQRGESTPHRGKWYAAETRFRHINGRLWEAVITTGVMHQIRVHAAFVGIPLAGDRVYGGGMLECPNAPSNVRFGLHHLGLIGGDLKRVEAMLPDWFE
jgi:23S rRNA-/tRNA-specific pseudouridylate synthase